MAIRTDFATMECPIARAIGCVGERWSFLILRDAFQGLSKFDEFQKSLAIAPNILSRQLKMLQKNGLLEARRYSRHASRYEYVLTQQGRDFFPVVAAMMAWSNTYLAPRGASLELADRASGKVFRAQVVNSDGAPVSLDNVVVVLGEDASNFMAQRLESVSGLKQD